MKPVYIHQPGKYGDFINILPIAQKLETLGYEVNVAYHGVTSALTHYFFSSSINFVKVNSLTDTSTGQKFCSKNKAIFINCQTSPKYNSLCTVHGGDLFIEELKYYVVENTLQCGLSYDDKFNFSWERNLDKEKSLINKLGVNLTSSYNIAHLDGQNGRTGSIPEKYLDDNNIMITPISGYTLLDWYPIIINAKNIFAIQSSAQCFIDAIKSHIPHTNYFLLNCTSNPHRLLVPAYGWDMTFFNNKTLK